AEDGIRDFHVTGVQTCARPIYRRAGLRIDVDLIWLAKCRPLQDQRSVHGRRAGRDAGWADDRRHPRGAEVEAPAALVVEPKLLRSEERRVGEEWRAERSSRPRE